MNANPEINIRDATFSDLPIIVEMMKSLTITTSQVEADGASTLTDYEEVFTKIEADPSHSLFVAEIDGDVVGSADLIISPNLSHRALPYAIVENVIVVESMRRKGIGRKLIQHMIDLARQNRCYKISLSSNKKRTNAHNLYQSLGFEPYGIGFRIYF